MNNKGKTENVINTNYYKEKGEGQFYKGLNDTITKQTLRSTDFRIPSDKSQEPTF